MMEGNKAVTQQGDRPPGKTACLYLSSMALVTVAISSLSLLRLLISICHYEYTNGRTVCAPQNVVLQKLPVEIPSRTLFLRVGGLEYDAASDCSFNGSVDEGLGSLTEHNLDHVDRANFSRFKDLKELSLLRCGINSIEKMAFSDLLNLRKLDLRFNRISKLEERTFLGLNLTVLDLSHNLIVKLPAFAFSGSIIKSLLLTNSSKLASIELSTFENSSFQHLLIDNSHISAISSDMLIELSSSLISFSITNQQTSLRLDDNLFHNFTLLATLDLSNTSLVDIGFLRSTDVEEVILDHNDVMNASQYFVYPEGTIFHDKTRKLSLANTKISSLPPFFVDSYRHLTHLDLSSNNFVSIDASVFHGLPALQVLDLSRNNISVLSSFHNDTLPSNLSSLHLHSNNIRTLSQRTHPLVSQLRGFTFHDNPVHCNCEVKWLHMFISQRDEGERVAMNWNKINCSTPLNVSIVEVDPEDFVCTAAEEIMASYKEVVEEGGVVLSCQVSSDPASNITWTDDLKREYNDSVVYPNILNIFKIAENFSNHSNNQNLSSSDPSSVKHKISLEVLVFVDEYTTKSQLFVSSPGNYTCHASNIVATSNHTFNTQLLQLTSPHFNRGAEKSEVMSSFEGVLLAALLIILIGVLIKKDSNALEQLS